MSGNARMISGALNVAKVASTASTAIAVGDMIYMASSKALPASSLADTGTKAGNQEAFHDAFLGVSLDQKRADETSTRDIAYATTGRYRVPTTDNQARDPGTLWGPVETGGTTLENQLVEVVATNNLAIGKQSKPKAASDTYVELEIVSTVVLGGPQLMI